jgi:alcohol dehydrogenase (NADP+)
VDRGLCRHLGVSNFSVKKLAALLDGARIRPEVNQVEMHPYLQQSELVDFCAANGVVVTAYSPLGSTDRPDVLKAEGEPILLEDPVIVRIAEERRVTPAQVLLSWAITRGTNPIPKSVRPERLAENLAAAAVELGDDDMGRIARLDRDRRYLDGTFWELEGSSYTLENLWDA